MIQKVEAVGSAEELFEELNNYFFGNLRQPVGDLAIHVPLRGRSFKPRSRYYLLTEVSANSLQEFL